MLGPEPGWENADAKESKQRGQAVLGKAALDDTQVQRYWGVRAVRAECGAWPGS